MISMFSVGKCGQKENEIITWSVQYLCDLAAIYTNVASSP